MSKLQENYSNLEAILETINNLPDANKEIEYCEVTINTTKAPGSWTIYYIDNNLRLNTITTTGTLKILKGSIIIFDYTEADGSAFSSGGGAIIEHLGNSQISYCQITTNTIFNWM